MDTLIFAIWTATLSIVVGGVLPLVLLETIARNLTSIRWALTLARCTVDPMVYSITYRPVHLASAIFNRGFYLYASTWYALNFNRPVWYYRVQGWLQSWQFAYTATRHNGRTYAMATVNPLRAMVRAFIQNQAGAVGSVWRADVEAIDKDDAKNGFTSVAVIPFNLVPGWQKWSELSKAKQAKIKVAPIQKYAIEVLANLDRHGMTLLGTNKLISVPTVPIDGIMTPIFGCIDYNRLRNEFNASRLETVLSDVDKVVRFGAHPEGVSVAIDWAATCDQGFARRFHAWAMERPLVTRNSRGSGRSGNASDDKRNDGEGKSSVPGLAKLRIKAWVEQVDDTEENSYHGRYFKGITSHRRVIAYTVPVASGFKLNCPACGAQYTNNKTSGEANTTSCDCGCTLVETWTSERGRLRAHWTDSDYKGRDGTRKLYGEQWTEDYEYCAAYLRSLSESYGEKIGKPVRWTARRTIKELNDSRKLEQGC